MKWQEKHTPERQGFWWRHMYRCWNNLTRNLKEPWLIWSLYWEDYRIRWSAGAEGWEIEERINWKYQKWETERDEKCQAGSSHRFIMAKERIEELSDRSGGMTHTDTQGGPVWKPKTRAGHTERFHSLTYVGLKERENEVGEFKFNFKLKEEFSKNQWWTPDLRTSENTRQGA